MKIAYWLRSLMAASLIYSLLQLEACTTTELVTPLPPNPPTYVQVPHPQGAQISDLFAIFTEPGAPVLATYPKTCDSAFKKLKSLTRSKKEFEDGVLELVKRNPVHHHWCFYAKLLELENSLKTETFVDVKQKRLLDTYEYLVPIAKVFESQFHDTRYLRIAVIRYRKASEWVFFRKLDLTPEGTADLVQPTNPFGLWKDSVPQYSVLEKYNIIEAAAQNPASALESTYKDDEPVPGVSPSPLGLVPSVKPPTVIGPSEDSSMATAPLPSKP